MSRIISCIIFISTLTNLVAQDLRDPVLWPYDKYSIWNTPIGSDAVYKPAGFEPAGHIGIDVGHIIVSDYTFKEYPVLNSPTWGPGRCSGETYLGFDMKVPDDWIVPDAGDSPYGNTPNSAYSYISPDRQQVEQGGKISRCEAGGPIYLSDYKKWPNNRKYIDLRGDGQGTSGQGASGMSTLGGTIRLGEFIGDEPIRHVVKINPWAAKYCHYSEEVPGYKWPAIRADSYAPDKYNRTADPDIVMGSLFALPPDLTPESLNIQTEPGRKLFKVLQDYGAYFTEDAAWDTWDIIIERNAELEFEDAFGFSMKSSTWLAEVNKLMQAVNVVTNNAPDAIGGGGVPRTELAPDFIPSCFFTVTTDGTAGAATNPSGQNILNLHSSTLIKVDYIPDGALFSHWEVISGNALIEDSLKSSTMLTLLSDSVIVEANFSMDSQFRIPRDPYKWPFSRNSIWNMPIGSGAEYTPQPIDPDHIDGIMVDADIIVLTPDEPLMEVFGTEYRWSSETNQTTRCIKYNDKVHLRVPVTPGYITTFYGTRPNNPGVILSMNGRTLIQTQPFQTCGGVYATTGIRYSDPNEILMAPNVDIMSDGIEGMHGGSGLSSLGGAIRMGELSPQSGPIRHTLKISFPGEYYLYYDHENDIGYRWPARKHDSNASTSYNGDNPEALQGCLRAIPPEINIDSLGLETEPARKIAWTLQNYGAYQVEGVPWARMMIAVEDGPEGSVPTEFKEDWGFEMITTDKSNSPWFRDMIKIMAVLHIVSNNGPESIGGGGAPLQPLAPDAIPFYKLWAGTDGTPGAKIHPGGNLLRLEGHEYEIKVTDIPENYTFSHWKILSGDPLIEDSLSTEAHIWLNGFDAAVEAVFTPDTFSLSVQSNGNGIVEVNPTDERFVLGSEIELLAVADSLWEFVSWSGDLESEDNPLTITIDDDIELTANFEERIDTTVGLRYSVPDASENILMLHDYVNKFIVFRTRGEDPLKKITIYNLQGQVMKELNISSENELKVSLSELKPGFYFSRVQDLEEDVRIFKFSHQ